MKEKCHECKHYKEKDGLDFCYDKSEGCSKCGGCISELNKVNEKEFKASNGHLWTISDYICKNCGNNVAMEVESYPKLAKDMTKF